MKLEEIRKGLRLARMLHLDSDALVGPLSVDVAVTNVCNYRCVFCGTHSGHSGKQPDPVWMSKDTLVGLLRELRQHGTREVMFAGNGEPLLSPALFQVLCERSSMAMSLMTNGSTLSVLPYDVAKRLRRIVVSINSGNGNSHKTTHGYAGPNQFLDIMDTVEMLLGYGARVQLSYVVTPDNQAELPDFYRLAARLKVKTHVRPAAVAAPGCPPAATLHPCYLGFIQPTVTASGDLRQCYGVPPVGNVQDEGFGVLWWRSRDQRLRAARMVDPLVPGCRGCANAVASSRQFYSFYRHMPWRVK